MNKSKLLTVVIALFMISCSVMGAEQSNSASLRILEPNDSYEIIWNRSDIRLSSSDNVRRSSMVAVPGKIILHGSKTTGIQTGKVMGLDSLTGETLWTKPGASGGELISHGENVYRGTYGIATVQSINIESGEVLWQTLLPGAHSTWDIFLADDKIFVHTNDFEFFILDNKGEILDSFSETDDAFLEMGGILYMEVYMEGVNGIMAVDFSSNKALWRVEAGTAYTYAPIFDHETIFFRTAHSPADIYSIDRMTGDINWKITNDILSNLYVTDDKVYLLNSDSDLVALDKFSGDELTKVKFSSPFNLDEENKGYFVSGDPANNMLFAYFGDNNQLSGVKVLEP